MKTRRANGEVSKVLEQLGQGHVAVLWIIIQRDSARKKNGDINGSGHLLELA